MQSPPPSPEEDASSTSAPAPADASPPSTQRNALPLSTPIQRPSNSSLPEGTKRWPPPPKPAKTPLRSGAKKCPEESPDKNDVVVGISASGRTPFTVAAVAYARAHGANTIAVTCNQHSPLGKAAHIEIVAEVGPEVLAGSSRMKAGSAEKMILNMLSTGAMTRLGYVYGNLMVHLRPKNSKLRERGVRILQTATGLSRAQATKLLTAAGNSVSVGLVMAKANINRRAAEAALKNSQGHVRQAILLAKQRVATGL